MRSVASCLVLVLASACVQSADRSLGTVAAEVGQSVPSADTEDGSNEDGTEPSTEPVAPEFPAGLDWVNTDRPLTLEEFRGRFVLLDFWTYGCINCIHIIPDLHRLEEEFADELVVIGVHSAKFNGERATDGIRDVVLRYGIEHPVVNDADFEIWQAYGVRAWPTVWLIGPDGHLIGRLEGEGVYDVVEPVLSGLVAERGEELRTGRLETAVESAPTSVLFYPGKVEVERGGDRLAIADTGHNQIVIVDRVSGDVRAVYGSGQRGFVDGAGLDAAFDAPQGMAFFEGGLFVADTGNHSVRHIDLESGLVTTIAGIGQQGRWPPIGGSAAFTSLYSPWDLLVTPEGTLLIAMAGSHQLWEFDPVTQLIGPTVGNGRESTLNGPVDGAELAQPSGVTLTPDGKVYFADSESSSIRWVADGEVGLLAGAPSDLFTFGLVDAVGEVARFQHPLGIDWWDGHLYVADTYNDALRVVDPADGRTVTLAGGQPGWADGASPLFDEPGGLSVGDGIVYLADTNNHAIRTYDLERGEADTLVVKGIERFRPIDQTTATRLGAVTLAEGDVHLVVDLVFPRGYKLNPEAPAAFSWSSTSGTVVSGDAFLVDPELPLTFSATVNQSGAFTLEMSLVYCEEEEESICLFEQALLELPVTAGGTATRATLTHEITLP